jgi:hypothetical protein
MSDSVPGFTFTMTKTSLWYRIKVATRIWYLLVVDGAVRIESPTMTISTPEEQDYDA